MVKLAILILTVLAIGFSAGIWVHDRYVRSDMVTTIAPIIGKFVVQADAAASSKFLGVAYSSDEELRDKLNHALCTAFANLGWQLEGSEYLEESTLADIARRKNDYNEYLQSQGITCELLQAFPQ